MKLKKHLIYLLASLLMLCGCSVNVTDQSSGSQESAAPYVPQDDLEELTVYSFKAGKADAHLIYNSKAAVLIDCGEKGFGKEIVSYLNAQGIRELDMLIITHFDKDHVGGAAKVLKEIPVKRVIQTYCIKQSKEYDSYAQAVSELGITPETPRQRISVLIGGGELTVCPPLREVYQDSPSNNASLITILRYGSCSMLFAADAEDTRLGEFLNTEAGHYDYVKMPYHGHYQTRLKPFLAAVTPQIAVITCSDEEPEDAQTMKLLAEAGAAVYLTRTAAVIAKCDGKGVSAFYEK